ncbi:MAG: 2Fe-2S iron-sulfur cluster-binding protein [Candidatus Marsarchaeota archaeon]|nr:2Fe-2S iron-sulfur cluster-binding protein [Candidatus Marsarchaeota archaeon]MCL5105833.1 2Fe-2S iron-sulfur cluster-binding protein [Candidatus Marsarchaeota archaeon]
MERKIKLFSSKQGRLIEYTVPAEHGMVVLDAVIYVLEHFDSSISARWNCKAGRCGSCGAEINGMPRLMCKTRLDSIDGDIEVAPMKVFPNVKDLVVDPADTWRIKKSMSNFKIDEKFTQKKKGIAATKDIVLHEYDVTRAQEFKKCIECFLCLDSCHVLRVHKSAYIGPMHVVKAASLDMNPLDSLDRRQFLDRNGIRLCNVTKCCTDVCPVKIKITDNAIIPEKERINDKKII